MQIYGGEEVPAKQNPNQRLGRPEDIAGAVVYLSSRAGTHVSGACLTVDGVRPPLSSAFLRSPKSFPTSLKPLKLPLLISSRVNYGQKTAKYRSPRQSTRANHGTCRLGLRFSIVNMF